MEKVKHESALEQLEKEHRARERINKEITMEEAMMSHIWELIEKTGMPSIIRSGISAKHNRPYLRFNTDMTKRNIDAFQYLAPATGMSCKLYSVLCALFSDYMARASSGARVAGRPDEVKTRPEVVKMGSSPMMYAYAERENGIYITIDMLTRIMDANEDWKVFADKYSKDTRAVVLQAIQILRWPHVIAMQCGKMHDFGPLLDCELYYDGDSGREEDTGEKISAHIILRRMPILGEWYSDIVPMINDTEERLK